MTTEQLAKQASKYSKEYLWLCRDHCGPYFLDSEKRLPLKAAVEATKKTIAYDIEQGFDLIHIDTSRVEDTYGIAEELFKFATDLNPNIRFEFGTEENVGVAAGAIKYREDVAFAKNMPNLEFVVAQTGSLVMEDRQVGNFYTDIVAELAEFAHSKNIKLKEHNADYLTSEQIQLRKQVGVDACNIAPQLGVIQTKKILELANMYNVDSKKFKNLVLESGRWKKWLIDGDDTIKINSAGHYCFNSNEYRLLINEINNHCDSKEEIEKSINHCLDLYFNNIT
jgi:hypothetical protein